MDNHNEENRHNHEEEIKHNHEEEEERLTDDDKLAALRLEGRLEVSVVGTSRAGRARTRRHLRL